MTETNIGGTKKRDKLDVLRTQRDFGRTLCDLNTCNSSKKLCVFVVKKSELLSSEENPHRNTFEIKFLTQTVF